VPHIPHEPGLPLQESPAEDPPATLEAKTDSFFFNFLAPQLGQAVPCQRLDRTSTSLSFPHFPQ